VLLNSAAALIASGRAQDFNEGIRLALGSITSGRALEKLNQLITVTNRQ
jgi:anthranilate phosphoribosyltransferase